MIKTTVVLTFLLVSATSQIVQAQTIEQLNDKFRQLDEYLAAPNNIRTASGAPGHEYWQQRADYDIDVTLDDDKQTITGSAQITYHNNSPDKLEYIWLHLDQNRFDSRTSMGIGGETAARSNESVTFSRFRELKNRRDYDGGFKITSINDSIGNPLESTTYGTLMRLELPEPMESGDSIRFSVSWWYNILDYDVDRQGFEHFERDDNRLYQIAHWYPRMAAYSDYEGWHNKEFQGVGEFTLEFGDYQVAITAPADHVIAATGELQNAAEVLTRTQRDRLDGARTASRPMFIITPAEALENEKSRSSETKTWHFKAENVRDFAFASSRKFIWDAMGYEMAQNGETVMAMSYYPMAGIPLWPTISTQAVMHTLQVYNKHALTYPYPVAISVNGPVTGMEYPMISFNPTRPTVHPDGRRTYGRVSKEALVMVIIHEVGHNYFPMIVNTDERQWAWMDEGLNSFLQNIAQQEWKEDYPLQRIDPRNIVEYMTSSNQVPIMTNAESIHQVGNNAYAKPATAFNILRESIMGIERFDNAFREFAQRWQFKRPTPTDFFRTMEDASGFDLDWFWRGWFYTTDHVDISLDDIRYFTINTQDPEIEEAFKRRQELEKRKHPSYFSNDELPKRVDEFPEIKDFYNENDEFTVTNRQRNTYNELIAELEDWQIDLLKDDSLFYMLDFSNIGGLVMPLFLEIEYADGAKEERRYPAQIWKLNDQQVTKMIITDQKIVSVTLDPRYETADADLSNNSFPRKIYEERIELTKEKGLMRRDMLHENLDDVVPLEQLINERTEKDESDAEAAARRLQEWADYYND